MKKIVNNGRYSMVAEVIIYIALMLLFVGPHIFNAIRNLVIYVNMLAS